MYSHRGLGNEYLKALSKSLKVSSHVKELSLSQNRLTNNGVVPLLKSLLENKKLVKNLNILNFSYNKLGESAINNLCLYMKEKECDLMALNLEANVLGNHLCSLVIKTITDELSHKFTLLNLAQNNINDQICDLIADLLEKCGRLQVLVLYWNFIKNYGGSLIMNKAKNHPRLKVLDISWNRLGSNLLDEPTKEEMERDYQDKEKTKNFYNAELNEIRSFMELGSKKKLKPLKSSVSLFTKELCELFKNVNNEVVHLDISHNNLNYIDCCQISNHF